MNLKIGIFSCVMILAVTSGSWSDSRNVELVWQDLLGDINDIYVAGQYAYLCAGGILLILDISVPFNPVEVGRLEFPGVAESVSVIDEYAYISVEYEGIFVINIRNPEAPYLVTTLDEPDEAWDIQVVGDYAYMVGYGNREDRLFVMDISNPTSPKIVGFSQGLDRPERFHVAGGYAYVIEDEESLRIFDVSDPTSPREVGAYSAFDWAVAVHVVDDYAYLVDEDVGLRIIDVSDPTNPYQAGIYRTGEAGGLYVTADYVYMASEDGLWVIDVSNPNAPREVLLYEEVEGFDIHVSGNYGYITEDSDLHIVDLSDPEKPREVGDYHSPGLGRIQEIRIDGDHAYIATGDIHVMDVSDPANLYQVASYEDIFDLGESEALYLAHGLAYVLDGDEGLWIVDISDPRRPRKLGSYAIPDFWDSVGIHVVGNYAYVIDEESLRIIDVSDPTNPHSVGSYGSFRYAVDIHVAGDYAYIADEDDGLRIVDVSDPEHPRAAGIFRDPEWATSVHVVGNYAYVGDEDGYLWIIDISDPTNPYRAELYSIRDLLIDFCIIGNYAFVGTYRDGIKVLDISDPKAPRDVGFYDAIPGRTYAISASGRHIYLGSREGFFHILKYTGTMSTEISVNPAEMDSPEIGEEFSFDIRIADAADVAEYQLNIIYDGAALRYISIEYGDFMPPGSSTAPPVIKEGAITITASSSAGGISGDGTLATVIFEVKSVKPSVISLDAVLYDPTSAPLDATAMDGIVQGGGLSVSGRVYYSTTPLDGVKIDLIQDDLSNRPLKTTETSSGFYEFSGVQPGSYHLKVYGPTAEYAGWSASMITVSNSPISVDLYIAKNLALISPINDGVLSSLRPILTWEQNPEAVAYSLQVNVTSTWELVELVKGLTTTNYKVEPNLLPETQYTWQVDAYDSQGHEVAYSERAFQFTTPAAVVFDPPEMLYYTHAKGIGRIELTDRSEKTLFSDTLPVLNGIAVDVTAGKMYWTERVTNRIRWANLDGTGAETLIASRLVDPGGISVDTVSGKIYWADSLNGKIRRASLDGTDVEDVVTQAAGPGDIALDRSGKIYWTEYRRVRRANLDGTNIEDIVVDSLVRQWGIAIDAVSGKVYWSGMDSEIMAGRIQRANLDGTEIEDVITLGSDTNQLKGIALDMPGEKIYWVDEVNGKIQRASFDGEEIEDVVTGISRPMDIALTPFVEDGPDDRAKIQVDSLGDVDNGRPYTASDGTNTLRKCIRLANETAGANTITFGVSGTISPLSDLPRITDDETVIDASSQWQGVWPGGQPGVTLDGNRAGYGEVGLRINKADSCHIRGLSITGFEIGIEIWNSAQSNIIGGTALGTRNVISGNNAIGVRIVDSDRNIVVGNYIGTDVNGTTALPNSYGVWIDSGAQSNTIGGTMEGARNIISGNRSHGVWILGSETNKNKISRNSIYDNGRQGIYFSDGGNVGIPAPAITSGRLFRNTLTYQELELEQEPL